MNQGVRAILQAQRELLDESAESMQTSQFVFPGLLGGQHKLDSYLQHFRRIRDFAGLPKRLPSELLPQRHHCNSPTVVRTLIRWSSPPAGPYSGSAMTRRYARFLASAQQNIADRSQRLMDEMLD